MVTPLTQTSGILRKIAYGDIVNIRLRSRTQNKQFHVPETLLAEKAWHDRDSMEHYASSTRPEK